MNHVLSRFLPLLISVIFVAGCDNSAPSPFSEKARSVLVSSKPEPVHEYLADIGLWTDGRIRIVKSTNFSYTANSITGISANIKDFDLDFTEIFMNNNSQNENAIGMMLKCLDDKECIIEHNNDSKSATGKSNFLTFVARSRNGANEFISIMKEFRKSIK